MGYEGEVVVACPPVAYLVHEVQVVVVSGAAWNPCGHAILYSKHNGGRYFHVAGAIYGYPRTMDELQYQRYLRENGKHEIRRQWVVLRDPFAAHRRLEQLLSKGWFWAVLPHNCVSFAEEVVKAGGSDTGLFSNCPSREMFR